jgi:PadR family transcriptional regulator, regulatory protein AphA
VPIVSSVRLTTTSYVVLGLVELCEPATPYEIKQAAEASTSHFWTLAHTQLYSECSRLSREGLLDERQEEAGRHRKLYRLTEAGTAALDAWRAEPVSEFPELRDPGILKLFFGAEVGPLARSQLETHRRRLATYLELAEREMPEQMRLALECGLGHEREYVRYWEGLAGSEPRRG